MILTVSVAPMRPTEAVSLSLFRSLVKTAARSGIDAILFLRAPRPAPAYDPLVLIAALAELDLPIGLGAGIPVDVSEPFHVARSFAAVDRLTGGRSALVIDTDPILTIACGSTDLPADLLPRRHEFFDVVGKLLDSWEDGALLVDRARGLFTDPARIHRINHDGAHYAVRGPLNAPRPLQGAPIIVAHAGSDPVLPAAIADVVIADGDRGCRRVRESCTAAGRPAGSVRVLADIVANGTATDLAARIRTLRSTGFDGVNVRLQANPAALAHLAEAAAMLGRGPWQAGTLRDRLGLARPASRYAA